MTFLLDGASTPAGHRNEQPQPQPPSPDPESAMTPSNSRATVGSPADLHALVQAATLAPSIQPVAP